MKFVDKSTETNRVETIQIEHADTSHAHVHRCEVAIYNFFPGETSVGSGSGHNYWRVINIGRLWYSSIYVHGLRVIPELVGRLFFINIITCSIRRDLRRRPASEQRSWCQFRQNRRFFLGDKYHWNVITNDLFNERTQAEIKIEMSYLTDKHSAICFDQKLKDQAVMRGRFMDELSKRKS